MNIFQVIDQLFNSIGAWLYGLLVQVVGFFGLAATAADPIYMLIQAIVVCTFAAVTFLALTYTERKIIARVQDRIGPNRVGPFGLLQPLADAIKMFTKEQTMPKIADALTFQIAPVLAAVPALMLFAVIPFGRSASFNGDGIIGGGSLVAADLDVGLIYIVALGSIAEIAIIMGGWGSRNKYSLLGAMRAVAQMLSYEIPLVLALMSVAMLAGTLNLGEIVEVQVVPFILLLPVAFLIFTISAAAETGRSPFDIIEAESEIVAGYHTEYAGMQFGLFQMGEFLGFYAQSCIMASVFMGGWRGPEFIPSWLWFWLKSWIGVFIFQWAFRTTFPRLRIDQLQGFCWKFLVPAALLNVGVIAILGHRSVLPITQVVNGQLQLVQRTALQWLPVIGVYLTANLIIVILLALLYRGQVRRSVAQYEARVPGGEVAAQPAAAESAVVA